MPLPLQGWHALAARPQGFTLGYLLDTPSGFYSENHFLDLYIGKLNDT
jgi:hypothetical protein